MSERATDKRLAAKQEERDFLLDSLDDLDAEYGAGDIDEADYRALRSDYTTRAAAAIRAVERRRFESETPDRSWGRTVLWVVGVAGFALLAGIWLADFSGSRGSNGQITGDIRETVRTRLFDAREAMGGEDYEHAIEIYDDVLMDEPSNAEALAYRGWLTNLSGDAVAARDFIEEAVAADAAFPDARVFAASLALGAGDPLVAADHLAALDQIESPPFIRQLIDAQQLDVRIMEAAGPAALELAQPVLEGASYDSTVVPVPQMVIAAEHLALSDRLEDALALFNAMLVTNGDDSDVLVAVGWFLGRASVGLDEGMVTAESYLDSVIEADPRRADALVYRAFVRFQLQDLLGAAEDLEAYDVLDVIRSDLDRLLAEAALREAVAEP